MLVELPNDSDGNALRSLIANGSDLSKEMEVEFMIDVPDRDSGLSFAAIVAHLGFQTSVEMGDKSKRWTCYCSRIMVATYESITEIQKTFEELGGPYNAKPDGWGTFGNSPKH